MILINRKALYTLVKEKGLGKEGLRDNGRMKNYSIMLIFPSLGLK